MTECGILMKKMTKFYMSLCIFCFSHNIYLKYIITYIIYIKKSLLILVSFLFSMSGILFVNYTKICSCLYKKNMCEHV